MREQKTQNAKGEKVAEGEGGEDLVPEIAVHGDGYNDVPLVVPV